MAAFDWLETALRDLAATGLARDPRGAAIRAVVEARARELGVDFIDASSNDYLGYGAFGVEGDGDDVTVPSSVSRETLSGFPRLAASGIEGTSAASAADSPGSAASRLLGGTRPEHETLERLLSTWVGHDSALLFSSGYAANVGLLSSLPQAGERILSDALNHASIIDGCRLSKASTIVYPHADLDALHRLLRSGDRSTRTYIVTESYFSMDADSPDLSKLREMADASNALLIVDEAHALGVFGPGGSGLCAAANVKADVVVGTLGKAVGLQGAFVAGPDLVRTWLWNKARSFIYSTASTPLLARLATLHVKQAQRDDAGRSRLHELATRLRNTALSLGFQVPLNSIGPIVPLVLGTNERAIATAETLRDHGILAYPIRPPTVPKNSARVRLTVTSRMTASAFDRICATLALHAPARPGDTTRTGGE